MYVYVVYHEAYEVAMVNSVWAAWEDARDRCHEIMDQYEDDLATVIRMEVQ